MYIKILDPSSLRPIFLILSNLKTKYVYNNILFEMHAAISELSDETTTQGKVMSFIVNNDVRETYQHLCLPPKCCCWSVTPLYTLDIFLCLAL